ncbi:cardiolipin synthase [Roseivirga thermotolerans]|uniref:Cardiolipin synthase n=1 Tax=Roseivirga thermotolerans TaxID=1758176 RepID=A0ABQ3I8Z1_9BACT|nr:cardiolipin synthase [Roseivirga thermotolerans]GHE67963.1 cardiolipin synthase [Roseivirga thermotolerans]
MLEVWQSISPFVLPLYYVAIFFVVIDILLENRNPLKTHSYLLLLLLLPLLGIVIYLFFGQTIRKRKIFAKKQLINQAFGDHYFKQHVERKSRNHVVPEGLEQYEKVIRFLNKDLSPLTRNNKVTVLQNGEQKFPELITALKEARHHIHLEYYIYEDGLIGQEIAQILKQKASEGVKVRVIVDGVGSLGLRKPFFTDLVSAGVQIVEFMPVLFPSFTSKINYRNHRKILVIDGMIGFTGGINISDRYINNGHSNGYWRDTHIKIEGEAVKTLQFLFILSWQFVTQEELLPDSSFFPTFTTHGHDMVQINASGPDWELASIMDSFFLAINSARHKVRIATPYFIPTESILDAIVTASRSDITIELMIPESSDSWIVEAASRSFIKQLLEADVKVYHYRKGFLHSKVIIIDDNFASVGSANMDYRSFDLNHEVNAYFYNGEVVQQLASAFEADKADCVQLGLQNWKKRSILQKLKESVCRLLAPLL